ncbi:alcohol oxidase [Fusarium phyllophilum]|uniref:Alcohol oxidase n=1 Tax=Fusarium phyllophilum TaxID=47803 RepID=A0A8H5NGR5_9HYPO|nr:alcohol oxidase [Fusarium phyllophilum]
MASPTYDYIVVGGGLAGCVLSSRIREYDDAANILLIEAGKDTRDRSDVQNMQVLNLGGELDWQYQSEPVEALMGRRITLNAGKGLGGSSAINSGQLPWFKKSELWFNDKNPEQHGRDGPIRVTCAKASNRVFPLAEKAAAGWEELGVSTLPEGDQNSGKNLGRAYICEARSDGKREWSANQYSLDGVQVRLETLVNRIVIQEIDGNLKATGVKLADGNVVNGHNIIISAGAFRSPQLLQLSGIGPKTHLQEFGIEPLVDLPEVGKNLSDHMIFFQHWRLRDPSAGHTIGSANPLFQQPQYSQGVPFDWIVNTGIPREGLAKAIERDEGTRPCESEHVILAKDRTFIENIIMFAKLPFPGVPVDAEHITSALVSFLPTSTGSVSLKSGKPGDHPKVNLNYLSTEVDNHVFREGLRQLTRFMLESKFSDQIIGESIPEGLPVEALALDDSDIGTCSMGKVVDTEFRVTGVEGLRVLDASVFPVPLSAHLQAPLYALSEQAAAIITGKV